MVGYGRHRSRQQGTRQQPDRRTETAQGKEQHPAVGMPQVRHHHPEHQGSAGHLCGLNNQDQTESEGTSESSAGFKSALVKKEVSHGHHQR